LSEGPSSRSSVFVATDPSSLSLFTAVPYPSTIAVTGFELTVNTKPSVKIINRGHTKVLVLSGTTVCNVSLHVNFSLLAFGSDLYVQASLFQRTYHLVPFK
jgi:hypothetical protein